jgi:hypothetical protein
VLRSVVGGPAQEIRFAVRLDLDQRGIEPGGQEQRFHRLRAVERQLIVAAGAAGGVGVPNHRHLGHLACRHRADHVRKDGA